MSQDPSTCSNCGSNSGLIKKFSAPNIGKGSGADSHQNCLYTGKVITPFGDLPIMVSREVRQDLPNSNEQIVQREVNCGIHGEHLFNLLSKEPSR